MTLPFWVLQDVAYGAMGLIALAWVLILRRALVRRRYLNQLWEDE